MQEYINAEPVTASVEVTLTRLPFEQIEVEEINGESAVELIELNDSPPYFNNWGATVGFTPDYTLVVRTIQGACEVVKWAAKEGKRVRVTGFRHTWR